MNKFYITTPIYYVNAQPHIGHTYTTLAADVLARYHRLLLGDENVFFLTGTDEHGSKIFEKAHEQNKNPQEFCDEVSGIFKDVWEQYKISHNHFVRTTDEQHKDFVQRFITKLKDNNALYEDEYEGLYCVGCEKFITEKELIDGKCPDHLKEPQVVKEKNWFFDLQKYLPKVESLIRSGEIEIAPEWAKKEVFGLIKQGVPNFSVSREKDKVKWGIELPWDDSQLVYVWCDALTNYISAVESGGWWPASVQLLAKDILKFHALYWPALLLAAGYEVPQKLFIHGFFTVNGQKMSKTIGNVIDPRDMLDEFGTDAAKYLLLTQFPFGNDGDIQKDRFVEKYNAELANGLGNLLNRVVSLVEKHYDGVLPEVSFGELDNKPMKKDIEKAWVDIWQCYHVWLQIGLSFDQCLVVIRNWVAHCDSIITNIELWKLVKEDKDLAAKYFVYLAENLRIISWMLLPFMENTAIEIQKQLGIYEQESQKSYEHAQQWGNYPFGTQMQKGDVLFLRK